MPAQFTKHFVQDLQQDIKIRQCGTIVFNADNESNVISVDLYNGQEEYSGGGSVAGACICPDGSTVPLTGSISGKTASVTLTGDCFAFPGQIGIGIQVVSGTTKTTVLKAIYNVELFETDDMVDPGSRITASVGQLVQDIEQATAEIPASDMASLMSGIAPQFSATTNYAAGAYVYYSGTLYRFTNAHAAGSWTGTDAEAVNISDAIIDLTMASDGAIEETRNIWKWGDQTVTGGKYVINKNAVIPGGENITYTLSAEITRASTANCRMYFYKNSVSSSSTNLLASPYLSGNSEHTRNSVTFSLPEDANIVIVASGPNTSSTAEAQWKNIQLELGTTETEYIPPYNAMDFTARKSIQELDDETAQSITEINEKFSNYVALRSDDSSSIPDGTNYNDIITPGNYKCTTAAHAGTMINAPANVAHRLFVISTSVPSYIMQVALISIGTNVLIKARVKTNQNEWFPSDSSENKWVTFQNDANIQTVLNAFLDNTLTATGKAADAKAVGDRFVAVDEAVENCNESMLNALGTRNKYIEVEASADSEHGNGKFWKITTDSETGISSASLGSSVNYYAYNPIPVSPGDSFKITINQASSTQQDPVLVVDTNYIILSRYRVGSIGVKNFDVTVDSGGAYILLTTAKTTTGDTAVKKITSYISDALKGLSTGLYDFRGKNVAIIGDSISTNGDYNASTNPFGNVPEIVVQQEDVDNSVSLTAYATYNDVGTIISGTTTIDGQTTEGHTIVSDDIGKEITFVPVAADIGIMIGKPLTYNASSVVTWWEILKELYNFNPIPVCWSGSSLTSHENGKNIYKTSYAWHDATIRKCGIRIPGHGSAAQERIPPDIVIVYRGVNDLSHDTSGIYRTRLSVGDVVVGGYPGTYPTTDSTGTPGNYTFGISQALMLIVKKIREAYPKAIIVFATLNSFIRNGVDTYPMNNGINTVPEYNETIRKVANVMGCQVIEFDKDGITFENVGDYTVENPTSDPYQPTHPNETGHKILAKRAMIDLSKINEFVVG